MTKCSLVIIVDEKFVRTVYLLTAKYKRLVLNAEERESEGVTMTNKTNEERLELIKNNHGLLALHADWLIQQTEQAQELETIASRRCAGRYPDYTLAYKIEKLFKDREIEIGRLRKALSIYANSSNYEPFLEKDENRSDAFNFIDLDGGETARQALKESST